FRFAVLVWLSDLLYPIGTDTHKLNHIFVPHKFNPIPFAIKYVPTMVEDEFPRSDKLLICLIKFLLISQAQVTKDTASYVAVEIVNDKSFEVFFGELELPEILQNLGMACSVGDKQVVKSLSLVGEVTPNMHKESMLKSHVFIIEQQLETFSKGLDRTVKT